MINADISNIWGSLSLPQLLALEREVFDAHMKLTEHTGRGADYLGWMALPDRMTTTELQRIRQAADRIRPVPGAGGGGHRRLLSWRAGGHRAAARPGV